MMREIKQPPRMFADVGPALEAADYRPIVLSGDAVIELAAIFRKIGKDYGGPLPGFKQRRPLSPEAREANRQRSKKWYAANKETAVVRASKWKQDNPERCRQIARSAGARYRAKRKAATGQRDHELEQA